MLRPPTSVGGRGALVIRDMSQQPDHRLFVRLEARRGGSALPVGQGLVEGAGLVGLEHRGMHVVLPAHGAGVVEALGHLVDGPEDRGFRLALAWARARRASSAATACSVPAQVRKSLAVKSSPVMSRR